MHKKDRLINIFVKIFIVFTFMFISKKSQSLLNLSMYNDFRMPEDSVQFSSFIGGTVVLFAILLLIYLVTNNYIMSIATYSTIFIAIALANNIKVSVRNEFIVFSDWIAVFAMDTMWPIISDNFLWIILALILLILVFIISIIISKKIDKKGFLKLSAGTRIVGTLLVITAGFFFFRNVEEYNNKYFGYQIDENRTNVDPIVLARKNGFVTSYLHTISPVFMDEPENYSKDMVGRIVEKYTEEAKDENAKYTNDVANEKTIFILSEAFIHSDQFENLLLSDSPTPFIDELIKENGGKIYPKTIAGGTANTEFSILSGFTLTMLNTEFAIPFSDFYASSPNHYAITTLADSAIGIHAHTSKLYNRKRIYDTIGFSEKRFTGEGLKYTDTIADHEFISDESFLKEIEDSLEEYDMVHGVSMQNHFPYENDYPEVPYEPVLNEEIFTEEYQDRRSPATFYFKGTYQTDQDVKKFIDYIELQEDNINVIFYGDHIPGKVIPGIPEYREAQYTTPFFIYKNHGRKLKGSLPFKISPAFLGAHFLENGEYKRPGFYYLIQDILSKEITEIYPDSIERNHEEIAINELDEETQEIVRDYQIIMYDSLFGSFYSGSEFFENY